MPPKQVGTKEELKDSAHAAHSLPHNNDDPRPSVPRPSLKSPNPNGTRPFDRVAAAGHPANPIEFPNPVYQRGTRRNILIHDQPYGSPVLAKNVLLRRSPRGSGVDPTSEKTDADSFVSKVASTNPRIQEAYWPVPHAEKIVTIMGHIEICHVLIRDTATRNVMPSSSSGGAHEETTVGDESFADDDDDDEDGPIFRLTDRHVAVKVNYSRRMERYRDRHAENPLKEVAAMQLIGNSNPHVMGLIEVLFDGQNLNVVMPYGGSNDLFGLLQDSQKLSMGRPEWQARHLFRQIIDGIRHLHSKGICHRDLSPENILYNEGNLCIIIDMGMALRVPYTDPTSRIDGGVTDVVRGTHRRLIAPQGVCGKLPYMSPEIFRNDSAFDGEAIDVWSAGTILFCMVTGMRSYSRPDGSDAQFYWMTHALSTLLKNWDISLSKECIHLLKHILQVDPRLRFTLDEIVKHPWFVVNDEEDRAGN